jgi:hypothetical protein
MSVQWPGSLLRPTTSGFSQSFTGDPPLARNEGIERISTAGTISHFATPFDMSITSK